jgi:NADH dehydrogenase [ubiquinone] 1 alpha subcomplex assembly factor 5
MKPLFDIEKIRANRAHARNHIDGHDFLFQKCADHVSDSLRDIQRDFSDILIIGERGARAIAEHFKGKNVTHYDVIDSGGETPPFDDEQFDCVIAMPYMHVVNNVPAFLIAIKSYLKPDGLFLNSFFGGHSLTELRQSIMDAELALTGGVSQHIHPMIDHYQCAGLMQSAGFALPVVDFDRVIVEYGDLETLYLDLKNMGEGNALVERTNTIHNYKSDIARIYKDKFFDKGYVATFDIIHAIGWKPDENQQKPAKRGSGQVSLTEIL